MGHLSLITGSFFSILIKYLVVKIIKKICKPFHNNWENDKWEKVNWIEIGPVNKTQLSKITGPVMVDNWTSYCR